jgi:chemotaxis response regulator CheB
MGGAMEKQIRVLVANRPKLMREVIIATFVDQPDIQIVGEVTEDSEIVGRVEETKPDFLFIGLDDPEKRPAVCDTVLRLCPELSIIAVAPHTNRSVRYWASFNIHSSVLEASEEAILAAMRKKAAFAGEAT